MCVIIAKHPHARPPTIQEITDCWDRNPHGAGFAYVDTDGGVSIRKGFMELKDLLAALEPLLAVETSTCIIHMRIATHGLVDDVNTHPFWNIKDKIAIAHNGILPYSDLVDTKAGRSDTNAFVEDILSKLPKNWYKQKSWVHVIEEYMGRGNKISVIDKDGITLLNESAWTEDPDSKLFFSNTHWKPVKSYLDYDYYKGGGQGSTANFLPGNKTTPTTPSITSKTTTSSITPRTPLPGGPPKYREPQDMSANRGKVYKRLNCFKNSGSISESLYGAILKLIRDWTVSVEDVDTFLDVVMHMSKENRPVPADAVFNKLGAVSLVDAIDTANFLLRYSAPPDKSFEDIFASLPQPLADSAVKRLTGRHVKLVMNTGHTITGLLDLSTPDSIALSTYDGFLSMVPLKDIKSLEPLNYYHFPTETDIRTSLLDKLVVIVWLDNSTTVTTITQTTENVLQFLDNEKFINLQYADVTAIIQLPHAEKSASSSAE